MNETQGFFLLLVVFMLVFFSGYLVAKYEEFQNKNKKREPLITNRYLED